MVFVGLLTLSLALYAPVLHDYFISDDFVLVRFVRTFEGSWLDFLVPWRIYSDPIVASRYKPFFVYLLAVQDAAFGDGVFGRHLLSVLTHALVGTGAFVVLRRLGCSFGAGLTGAVLFVASRLHSQAVSWTSSLFHLVSVALFVWGLVALHSGAGRRAVWLFGGLVAAGLLTDPELVVAAPVVVLLALRARTRTAAWGALVMVVLTLGCAVANLISLRHFPDADFSLQPNVGRFGLVFLDLFMPFEVPLAMKVFTLLAVLGACAVTKDSLAALLLLAATPAAVLWSSIGAYDVTPRHLYLPALFTALAAGQLGWLMLGRFPRVLALGVTGLVIGSGVAMRRYDFVLLDGRAEVGARLREEQLAARAAGERRAIWVRPSVRLTAEDLRFFSPELQFVEGPGNGARVIDSGESEYVRRLGPGFAHRYWPWVWFSSG